MNESEFRKKLVEAIIGVGMKVQPLEDMHHRYVPDMAFAICDNIGFIELKYLQTEPKTLGHIPHYTKGQENWLIEFGSRCFLIVGLPGYSVIFRSTILKKARKDPFELAVARYGVVCGGSLGSLASMLSVIV